MLLVCGLDRPVTAGRIQRGEALAWDAGAHPLLVLTKADLADDLDGTSPPSTPSTRASSASSPRRSTASRDRRAAAAAGRATSVLLGESGAGKSRLVNAVLGTDAAVVGAVRDGDAKGRHTTTNRQLHLLASGGVLIDSPGIREVGLAGDEESVDATFADIEELGDDLPLHRLRATTASRGAPSRWRWRPASSPQERLDAYADLRTEAASAARRADEHERRAYERRFTKAVKAHVKNKPSNRP